MIEANHDAVFKKVVLHDWSMVKLTRQYAILKGYSPLRNSFCFTPLQLSSPPGQQMNIDAEKKKKKFKLKKKFRFCLGWLKFFHRLDLHNKDPKQIPALYV